MKQAAEISVLMISLDEGLLGQAESGDVLTRHCEYAEKIQHLHIIVIGGTNRQPVVLSEKCTAYPTGSKNIGSIYAAYQIAKKLITANKIDLIDTQDPHLTGLIGVCLKRKFKLPLEVHFHGDFWDNANWRKESAKNLIYALLQPRVVAQADAIRVASPAIERSLRSSKINQLIEIISTPIDEKIEQQIIPAQVEGLKKEYGQKILLFVGRFVAAKNIIFMLQVFKKVQSQVPEVTLVMIGDGPLLAEAKKFAENSALDKNCFFIGTKNHQELASYYAAASLLVLLSTNESFGKVIVEAGICGTSAVASATTGARFIIQQDTTGMIVPINDENQSVKTLVKLLSDEQLRAGLAMKAKSEYRERFNRQASIEKIITLWLTLANQDTK